jgi:hypothetical protein
VQPVEGLLRALRFLGQEGMWVKEVGEEVEEANPKLGYQVRWQIWAHGTLVG